jgi:hypothetical protein
VAAPLGTSFDVGQLKENDKRLVAGSCQAFNPASTLSRWPRRRPTRPDEKLKARLRDESFVIGRSASEGGWVFVDDDEFPGAITPSGIHTVEGNKVTVMLHLRRDGIEIVTGTKDDTAAKRIEGIKAAIKEAVTTLRSTEL